jgi:plastocyanin
LRRKAEMNKRQWFVRMVGMSLAAFLLAAGSGPLSAVHSEDKVAPNAVVKIDNFSFAPGNITIAAGATVTWTNNDDVPHVVSSDDKSFRSKALDTDDRFSYTFTKPGTYTYYCAIHPKMTAKVVVQ